MTKLPFQEVHDLDDKTIVKLIKYINEVLLDTKQLIWIKRTQQYLPLAEVLDKIKKKDQKLLTYYEAITDHLENLPNKMKQAGEEATFIFHRILILVEQKEHDYKQKIKILEESAKLQKERIIFLEDVVYNKLEKINPQTKKEPQAEPEEDEESEETEEQDEEEEKDERYIN